ncbi:uncharacterized protein M421DRAFT_388697 [Didymella exigua CBS 183.55]|uniref:Uncharacterized protein n=1 Tax=Didymella exigua CBS 183.55 TaxID=1150837 RepID=A0A6A5S2R6_9PLEO|nr:uncharacterized protein M421DRAFT_388697 [Didymella exigua CBS 183.55]KAF1934203.1 hypothetical protein M421DRAFT_388697 [Didymella exigua CBS 183.55]
MRVFGPSLNDQAQAQEHNYLTRQGLHTRGSDSLLANCYETWVCNESLRRTITMSLFVSCVWSLNTRGGLADQVPVLAQIPFTKDLQAWKSAPDE